jgi:hypothetical protein
VAPGVAHDQSLERAADFFVSAPKGPVPSHRQIAGAPTNHQLLRRLSADPNGTIDDPIPQRSVAPGDEAARPENPRSLLKRYLDSPNTYL